MTGQMTIFDYLPRPFDPVRCVAMAAGAHWTDGKDQLIKFCNTDPDIEPWTQMVRHQYCPYGACGYYGGGGDPCSIKGWEMRTDHISVEFIDASGTKQTQTIGWDEFAREIADIIWSNDVMEWRGEDETN